MEIKPNFSLIGKCFSLIGKCFSLTNFSNGKQTQESLESDFPKTTFQETNTPKLLLVKHILTKKIRVRRDPDKTTQTILLLLLLLFIEKHRQP